MMIFSCWVYYGFQRETLFAEFKLPEWLSKVIFLLLYKIPIARDCVIALGATVFFIFLI